MSGPRDGQTMSDYLTRVFAYGHAWNALLLAYRRHGVAPRRILGNTSSIPAPFAMSPDEFNALIDVFRAIVKREFAENTVAPPAWNVAQPARDEEAKAIDRARSLIVKESAG